MWKQSFKRLHTEEHTILRSVTIMTSKYFISSKTLRGICKTKWQWRGNSKHIIWGHSTTTASTNFRRNSWLNTREGEVKVLHKFRGRLRRRPTARFFLRFSQDNSSSSESSCSSSSASTHTEKNRDFQRTVGGSESQGVEAVSVVGEH